MNLFPNRNSVTDIENTYGYQEGDWQGREGGINWEIVTDIYILPNSTTTKYILPNKIDNENQAYSTGNSVQYFVMTCRGIES